MKTVPKTHILTLQETAGHLVYKRNKYRYYSYENPKYNAGDILNIYNTLYKVEEKKRVFIFWGKYILYLSPISSRVCPLCKVAYYLETDKKLCPKCQC